MNPDILRAKKLIEAEQPDEALRLCNKVMNEEFDSKDGQLALFMAAYVMMDAERWGMAYHLYNRCAQLNPNQTDIYSNMGMCLEEHNQQKALKKFEISLSKDPTNAKAWANKGLMLMNKGKPAKCIECCDKALELEPRTIAAKHNKGLAKIMMRDWSGWDEYSSTYGVKHREIRDYGFPLWDGKSEGTVLMYGEQGIGDEIMFASILDDVSNPIVFDCDSRLLGLFERSFDFPVYGTRFNAQTPILDDHKIDWQFPIGNLPALFRRTDESYPDGNFLKTDPERDIQWKALFATYPGKKIGISWNGGLPSTGSKKRSINIEDLSPLIKKGNTYISLEYKDVSKETLDKYGIKSFPRATKKGGDIDDLASLIGALDEVITVSSAVVYVAGSIGKKCTVLVPNEPSYRYHLKGEMPWFKSVKLERQRNNETWSQTVKRIYENDNK